MKLKIQYLICALFVIIALVIVIYNLLKNTTLQLPQIIGKPSMSMSQHKSLPDSKQYYFLTPLLNDTEPNSDGYYEERFF